MSLHIASLSKSFGSQIALDNLHLTLDSGIVALLGANGSGKSTLLRTLATLTKPDAGNIQWNDLDYARDIEQLRQRISYLPQELELPDDITPHRLLSYLARMRLIFDQAPIDHLLSTLNLSDVSHQPLSKCSGGQIRLVGIAQAFLGKPPLLLLDEPFHGLAFDERRRVNNLLEQIEADRLIIFSTHIPAEAERLAQHLLILQAGRLLFHGTPHDLTERAQGCVWELQLPAADVAATLQLYRVSRVNHQPDCVTLRVVSPTAPEGHARPVTPCLEDAYLLLTTQKV